MTQVVLCYAPFEGKFTDSNFTANTEGTPYRPGTSAKPCIQSDSLLQTAEEPKFGRIGVRESQPKLVDYFAVRGAPCMLIKRLSRGLEEGDRILGTLSTMG